MIPGTRNSHHFLMSNEDQDRGLASFPSIQCVCKLLIVLLSLIQLQAQAHSESKANRVLVSQEVSESPQESPTTRVARSPGSMINRREQWRQRRLQKLQRKEVPQRSTFEKAVLLVEKKGIRNLVRYKDFYPQLGSITTGSGFAPGVRYWKPDINGSGFDLQSSAAFSFKEYQLYDLQFGKIHPRGEEFFLRPNISGGGALQLGEVRDRVRKFFLYADVRYRDFPEEDFFGLGPHSREGDRSDFSQTDISYDAVVGYQLSSWLSAAARVGYQQIDIDPGQDSRFPDTHDLFDDVSAPGVDEEPDFLHVSSGILVDFRDRPGNPHRGGMLGFSFMRFDDRGGDGEFEFTRFAVDARYFLPLGSVQRVLALRFFTSLDDENNGSRVPFYLQEALGGDTTLRGFRNFRFRDTNLLYLSAEYRWEALPALELTFFYDRGKVFADRADWDFTGLEKGFGFGIRAKTLESVVIRLEIARSREDTKIHFKFGGSF